VLTLNQVSKTRDCSIRTVQRQFAELAVLRSYKKLIKKEKMPEKIEKLFLVAAT